MAAPKFPLDMVQWTCCRCGVTGWMQREVEQVLRQSSASFHCLYGHPQHYPQGKSREEQLEASLRKEVQARQRADQRVAQWQDEAKAEKERADKERARANGYKGNLAKMSARVKGGACPCCNRYFVKLHKHMTTRHPGFAPPTGDPLGEIQVAG